MIEHMKQSGITLIELLITIVVLAIGVTLAIPSFNSLTRNNQITTASNNLVRALQLARSEAVKRSAPVTVCRSTDQASCAATGTAWQSGWIVFVEDTRTAGNTFGKVDASETANIIGAQEALSSVLQLTASATSFTFNPSGRPAASGSVKVCDDRQGANGNTISLNATGRVRLEKGASCP